MITGAHSIIYSTNAEADRAFLRDVLKLTNVDVGDGWLIFGLPPAEVAVHPSDKNDVQEFYLMCDDVEAFVTEMQAHGITTGPVQDEGWGVRTHLVPSRPGPSVPRARSGRSCSSLPCSRRWQASWSNRTSATVFRRGRGGWASRSCRWRG